MTSSLWLLIQLKIVRKQPYAVALEDIYHVYCAIWSAVVGENVLQCERELDNVKDRYTVGMGHLTTNLH